MLRFMSALTFEILSAELTQSLAERSNTPPETTARCTLGRDKVMVLVEYPLDSAKAEPLASQTLDWLEQQLRQQFDTTGLPEEAADLADIGSEVSVQLFLKHLSDAKPFTMRSFVWKVDDSFDDLFGAPLAVAQTQAAAQPQTVAQPQAVELEAYRSPIASRREVHYETPVFHRAGEGASIPDLDSDLIELPAPYFQDEELVPAELDDEHLQLDLEPELDLDREIDSRFGLGADLDLYDEAYGTTSLDADLAMGMSVDELLVAPDSDFSLPGEPLELPSDEFNLPTLEIPGSRVADIQSADADFFNLDETDGAFTRSMGPLSLDWDLDLDTAMTVSEGDRPRYVFEDLELEDLELTDHERKEPDAESIEMTRDELSSVRFDEDEASPPVAFADIEASAVEVEASAVETSQMLSEGSYESFSPEFAESEPVESEFIESEFIESEFAESEPVESESIESELIEFDSMDAEPMDVELSASETVDSEPFDFDRIDAESLEAQFDEFESIESEPFDFGSVEAESIEAESNAFGVIESEFDEQVPLASELDESELDESELIDFEPTEEDRAAAYLAKLAAAEEEAAAIADRQANDSQADYSYESEEDTGEDYQAESYSSEDYESEDYEDEDEDYEDEESEDEPYEDEPYEDDPAYYLEGDGDAVEDIPFEDVALVDDTEVQRQREQWKQQSSPNPWVFAGAFGFVLVGVLGYGLTRPCTFGQCDRLQTAQAASEEALSNLRIDSSAEAVTDSKQQLKRSIGLLTPIPVWSSYYAQAQAALPGYEAQVEALDLVSEAQTTAYAAAVASQNPPHPASQWQTIADSWQKAAQMLEQVPIDSPVRELVNSKLVEYRANRATILVRIDAESKAEVSLRQAQQAASLGTQQLENAASLEAWEKTLALWESAVDKLSQIPNGTYAHGEAQKLLPEYLKKLDEVRDRAEQELGAGRILSEVKQLASAAQKAESDQAWSVSLQKWKSALSQLQTVPPKTLAHLEAQTLQATYSSAVNKADNNLQVALRFQPIEPNFFTACGMTGTQRCTYSIKGGSVRLNLVEGYDTVIDDSITPPDQRSLADSPAADLVAQANQLLQEITLLSTQAKVPVALYDAKGEFLALYRPDLSGFTRQLEQASAVQIPQSNNPQTTPQTTAQISPQSAPQ